MSLLTSAVFFSLIDNQFSVYGHSKFTKNSTAKN